MLRAPAPTSRARHALTAPVLVPSLVLALAASMTGCGEAPRAKAPAAPSKETVACRAEWRALEQDVAGRDAATTPSALATRWNTVSATIDYYATTASTSDCDKTLDAQETAIKDLARFSRRLERYDMELRLEEVSGEAEAYAAGPRPPAPRPGKGTGKKKPAPRAPKPADIAVALKTLKARAPQATQEQLPAWQQATVTELSDESAVKKAVKDLTFLSQESKAYRTSSAALARIDRALSAKSG